MVYDAHPESDAGISAIIQLKTESNLLRGNNCNPDMKLIATASFGAPQFRIWRMAALNPELIPYLKIETTFTSGISFLLETHETQLVAAQGNTIKFYDFIDKSEQDQAKAEEKQQQEMQEQMKVMF